MHFLYTFRSCYLNKFVIQHCKVKVEHVCTGSSGVMASYIEPLLGATFSNCLVLLQL